VPRPSRAVPSRPLLASLAVALAALLLAGCSTLAGSDGIETQAATSPAGTAQAYRATATGSGSLDWLPVYLDSASTSKLLVAGIYADSGGHPGALLAKGSVANPAAGGWNVIKITGGPSLSQGTPYWVAILGAATAPGSLVYRKRAGGSAPAEASAQTDLSTLPDTWSSGTASNDGPFSAYAAADAPPVLGVSPASLSFTADQGGAAPAAQDVAVANSGSGTLRFTASADSPWLSVSPTSGTGPQTLQVGVDPSGLSAGTYSGQVTVSGTGNNPPTGSPKTVAVTFTVNTPAAGGDWLQVDHDSARTGFASEETAIDTTAAVHLKPDWATSLDGKVTAQPLFASAVQVGGATRDVIIAATSANSVYALRADTGAQLWRRNLGAPGSNCAVPGGFGIGAPGVIDRTGGRVYVIADDGKLYSLNLTDGTDAASSLAVFENPARNKLWGGLNRVGSSLYAASASDGCDGQPWRGRVQRIDISGASPALAQRWDVVPGIPAPNGGGGIWGYGGVSADTSTGRVYAATSADSNELYTPYALRLAALDSNLSLLGSYEPPHPGPLPCTGDPCDSDFGATPTVFTPTGCQTMVAAGNKDGYLYVMRTGDLAASGAVFQRLQLNAGNDWLGSGGVGGVPAWWPQGQMLFVTDAGPGIGSVAGGVVALAVQPDCTLAVAWSRSLGGAAQPNSTPTVANGVVYVNEGNGGYVHAYDAANGTPLWTSAGTGGAGYAAPIVARGRVYAGSWDGFAGGSTGSIRAFKPVPPTGGDQTLLGDEAVEPQVDQNVNGSAEAFEATATTTGTLRHLKIYLDPGSTVNRLTAGIYTTGGPHPGVLLTQGSKAAPGTGWVTIDVPDATVTAGTTYWVAILGTQGGTMKFRDRAGGCRSETSSSNTLTALPGAWTTGTTYTDCPLSAFGVGPPG